MPVLKPNQLKRRLAGGRKAFGAWLHTASPMAVEVLAGVGYDVLIIDNEHGPASLQATHAMLQASVPYDLGVGVRVPIGDPVYFKQLLDMGADSVMVPMVHNADQARAVVDACRYPPKGSRGIGPWRAMANGISIDDYRAHMADNLFIMVQIESVEAMENAEAIARVDGIDLLVIGPNDLSGSMGIVGQFDHKDHLAAMDRILAAATKAGKPCCTVPYGKFDTASLFKRGYSLILASTEYSLMRRSALAEIADAKKAMGNG